jgi:Mn-dependent DtxR family transcriptional regulator
VPLAVAGRGFVGSDTLSFTQEYLAEMLGVRRTSVTVVAHTLQSAGFIKYARGKIQIVNEEACRKARANATKLLSANIGS